MSYATHDTDENEDIFSSHPFFNLSLILLGVLTLFLGVSIFSYHPEDAGWTHSSSLMVTHNLGGAIGATIADTSFFIFGFCAYLIPFLLLIFLFVIYLDNKTRELICFWIISAKLLGVILLIISTTSLSALNIDDSPNYSSGGLLGVLFSLGLLNHIDATTLTISMLTLWVIGFTVLTSWSPLKIAEKIGEIVLFTVTFGGSRDKSVLEEIDNSKEDAFDFMTNEPETHTETSKNHNSMRTSPVDAKTEPTLIYDDILLEDLAPETHGQSSQSDDTRYSALATDKSELQSAIQIESNTIKTVDSKQNPSKDTSDEVIDDDLITDLNFSALDDDESVSNLTDTKKMANPSSENNPIISHANIDEANLPLQKDNVNSNENQAQSDQEINTNSPSSYIENAAIGLPHSPVSINPSIDGSSVNELVSKPDTKNTINEEHDLDDTNLKTFPESLNTALNRDEKEAQSDEGEHLSSLSSQIEPAVSRTPLSLNEKLEMLERQKKLREQNQNLKDDSEDSYRANNLENNLKNNKSEKELREEMLASYGIKIPKVQVIRGVQIDLDEINQQPQLKPDLSNSTQVQNSERQGQQQTRHEINGMPSTPTVSESINAEQISQKNSTDIGSLESTKQVNSAHIIGEIDIDEYTKAIFEQIDNQTIIMKKVNIAPKNVSLESNQNKHSIHGINPNDNITELYQGTDKTFSPSGVDADTEINTTVTNSEDNKHVEALSDEPIRSLDDNQTQDEANILQNSIDTLSPIDIDASHQRSDDLDIPKFTEIGPILDEDLLNDNLDNTASLAIKDDFPTDEKSNNTHSHTVHHSSSSQMSNPNSTIDNIQVKVEATEQRVNEKNDIQNNAYSLPEVKIDKGDSINENPLFHPLLFRNTEKQPKPAEPLPTLDLLNENTAEEINLDEESLQETAQLIESALADFKINVKVVDIFTGPVITRYELELAPGIRAARITVLDKDLARALSVSSVRVVEVIPGKPYVGLELPNPQRETLVIRDVIDSDAFREMDSPLTLVLGKDIAGSPVVANLAKMPHLLVAGTTGSGKSVGVNAMLISMLYKASPEDVKFIMIDPKMLELSIYNDIPHLLTQVVTDMKNAFNALQWCVTEMERRYQLMAALGVRNLEGYNEKIKQGEDMQHRIKDPLWKPSDSMETVIPYLEKLPYIVVVVDEFADLMMTVGKKIEDLIARLAQKARAAGIHLILATQRPSVDVITGLIKANVPTRIAFTVSSKIDSRTILDQGGAESLLGMGDMLYLPPNSSSTIRVHGAYVNEDEVHKVVSNWKARGRPNYIDAIVAEASAHNESQGSDGNQYDEKFDAVVQFVIETQRVSISGIQRKFEIGYNRAAKIVEKMEEEGIVSTPSNNGTRVVLAK